MSTTIPKARKLSSFVKCGRCRQDRQKCERPDIAQKCIRCEKYRHDCDPGRLSNRAQRSPKQVARQRATPNERKATVPSTTQHAPLAADSYQNNLQETFALKVEEATPSQTSREASSERSTSVSTPGTEKSMRLQHFPNAHQYQNYQDSASSLWCTSYFDESLASFEHSTTNGWETVSWSEPTTAQRVLPYEDDFGGVGLIPDPSGYVNPAAVYPVIPAINTLSGLTNIRPSRYRISTPFEDHLDDRVNRLWGSYKTFANASSKGLGITPLFGRTLSELFRQSRQMAETDDLVKDVRYACGAADACMNTKLPERTRAQYLEAYQRYDSRANTKYRRAVQEFAEKIDQDDSPDVLPLYTATFLYYAAGACMRGSIDVAKAVFAFEYFNRYTAGFPIRVEVVSTPNGTWAVDMLLANNPSDPGMRINTLMFALGRARLEFDRKDGLC